MSVRKIFSLFIATILMCLPLSAFAEEIVIFHTNDMHSRVLTMDDNNKSIGLAYISAYVKNMKEKDKNTLWLDAGDTLHGMPRINISKGENMVLLLNEAGLDAMCPGNHDFNYGPERLVELSKKCKFPVLSANVFWKKNGERLLNAYKIFTLENGLKVGVFGLTTPDTLVKASPVYMTKLNFLDIYKKTSEVVEVLKPQCDVIIALTHLGVSGSDSVRSIDIAKNVPGIDVIIDGHSHTELPQGLWVNNTLIAQTGCYEHTLGKVTIDVENKKITKRTAALLSKEQILKVAPKPDEKIENAIKEIDAKNAKFLNEKVAYSPKTFKSDRSVIRREEAPIGNLVADGLRAQSGADIAIINSGTIRTDLKQGDVTKGDILAIFPFGNMLQTKKITGRDLKIALEHSVGYYPAEFGGFLQISGFTFEFDPTLPKGSRVSNIMVNGAPLDENKIYKTASADFVFVGGDGYALFKDIDVDASYESIDEAIVNYLTTLKNFDIPLGRIKRLKDVPIPETDKAKAMDKKSKPAIEMPAKDSLKKAA